ncbi:molybdopterin-binding protein [Azonexus sp.]|jgi:molybdopterin-biosynthesis enzyme MoeA-like protein|uniref:competence/damage-inducible protein A n=1 Tax=Azonexus sp. TaxID=1872668 RepID=UPI002823992F|nr:molybdopterin-binding protein [Azonexus sp.]MDR1996312.1 competence/damage-inducible protein A [Azonexus sp.]
MSRTFGAVIIGDEILSGKRQDKHFARIAELLAARGLQLSWVDYLGDDRARLAATFRRTLAAGDVVFSCGGIGNTPDDHTRQAAAAALGVGLELHPQGYEELQARFVGEEISEQRKLLVTFPAGASIVPNPFNRIPGFMAREHYFVPGFPQMAHPMIEWALDTFHRDLFQPADACIEKAFLLTGPAAYESALLDLMERIVVAYPDLRLFSLPSLIGKERRHLELGVEGAPERVDRAMAEIRTEVEQRGIDWAWRP